MILLVLAFAWVWHMALTRLITHMLTWLFGDTHTVGSEPV